MDFAAIAAMSAAVAAVFSALLTHAFSKAKSEADVQVTMAGAAGTAVEAITVVLEQLRLELEGARVEIHQLREDNKGLRESVALLNVRISELRSLTPS